MKFLKYKKTLLIMSLTIGINALVFAPSSWQLVLTGNDYMVRFGHGVNPLLQENTKIYANFGCNTFFFNKKVEEYMGSTRDVIPLEIVTFLPALAFKIDIGPWAWYNKDEHYSNKRLRKKSSESTVAKRASKVEKTIPRPSS